MATEIERKFLVKSDDYRAEASSQTHIVQGFLSVDPERTVRIRLQDRKGMLTIKGKSNASGTTREEWEYEIDHDECVELMQLSIHDPIDKIRYKVDFGKYVFEVDEFGGSNQGLILAELELDNEDENFPKPSWLGMEVTGDPKYYNSRLSEKPFKKW